MGCQLHGRIGSYTGILVVQAYYIFSIGNIKPILTDEYPDCFKTYTSCEKTLTQAPDYTQIIGEWHGTNLQCLSVGIINELMQVQSLWQMTKLCFL
jgi:hypothetical protein